MPAASTNIRVRDDSLSAKPTGGFRVGLAVITEKGKTGDVFEVNDKNQLRALCGNPRPELGSSYFSALQYLNQGKKLTLSRAIHDDAKSSAVLVRSKVLDIPDSATAEVSPENFVIKQLEGLTESEYGAYNFPVYRTNKVYSAATNQVKAVVTQAVEVLVNDFTGLEVGNKVSFSQQTLQALNNDQDSVGENLATYEIKELRKGEKTFDKITVATAVTVVEGTEILKVTGATTTEHYANTPKVTRSVNGSKEILITNADLLKAGDTLRIGSVDVVFNKKSPYKEPTNELILDRPANVSIADTIYKVEQSEFEERDAFMVAMVNQGAWGGEYSIGIRYSKNYSDTFYLDVYDNQGVRVESHEVSRVRKLDGFNQTLYIEDKINGNSPYIRVKDNPNAVDGNGNPTMPLETDYSYWRQQPEDVFVKQTGKLVENLLEGHTEIKVSDVTGLSMGDRIILATDSKKVSAEYKIVSINATANTFNINRPMLEVVNLSYTKPDSSVENTYVHKFDANHNDVANSIVSGIQYFKVKKLEKPMLNTKRGQHYVISGDSGHILDAGISEMTGGSNGSPVTVGDLITAVSRFSNRNSAALDAIGDAGHTNPAFAQALYQAVRSQKECHGYISLPFWVEAATDYKAATKSYMKSLGLDTDLMSIFARWVQIFDSYNQRWTWLSPDSAGLSAQTYTTKNFYPWVPAAGKKRGKVVASNIHIADADLDFFVENRINPIKEEQGALYVWGNETMLRKPSPLQLRSVAMLLIVIRNAILDITSSIPFDLNNERTWTLVEGALNAFMRDEIQANGGVYKYILAIKDVITAKHISDRKMPIYLGIQPTMDIQTIEATIAIHNNGQDADIQL